MELENELHTANQRKPWIEPEVHALDVRETATNPGRGGDNPGTVRYYPDCTKS